MNADRNEQVILTNDEIATIYRHRARHYDLEASLYRLIGFRLPAYRKMSVDALQLRRGDTVVEIGCGTGLNLPLLQEAVGREGKVIGVDLTDAMLAQARRRVGDAGWTNVELVQSDATKYEFPSGVNGIISTLAITLVPEFDGIVRRGRGAHVGLRRGAAGADPLRLRASLRPRLDPQALLRPRLLPLHLGARAGHRQHLAVRGMGAVRRHRRARGRARGGGA